MRMADEYDIGQAFAAIERELMASMIRNMQNHKVEEVNEQRQWAMWQVEQLKALEGYKRKNKEVYGKKFQDINKQIDELIRMAKVEGEMNQETAILRAIKRGSPARRVPAGVSAEFFRLNERKLEALLTATQNDMQKAETAILRMSNDRYRRVIFNAQVYANTGAGTYEKAVDMATKDFISAGLNCVEYRNGARHTLSDYADMAIRTASKRAYLQGEGQKRKEWGIATVIMNKRGNPCPKCLPFCGKILIDDVWSGGTAEDGPYPLMSAAISAGLYHPRCKDSHTTYFPGISTPPDSEWKPEEIAKIEKDAKKEVRQQYARRQTEKYGRLAEFSLDDENRKKYKNKKDKWKKAARVIDTIFEHAPKKIDNLPLQYKNDIISILGKSDNRIKMVVEKYWNDIVFVNERSIGGGIAKTSGICVNYKIDANNPRGSYTTTFHEIGHSIDKAAGRISYKSPDFKNALENDFDNVVKAVQKEYNLTLEGAFSRISMSLIDAKYHCISDIAGALTENRCRGKYGHTVDYWKEPNALEREAFAHFFQVYARNDIEKINAMIEMFPNATDEFFKLLEEVL